MVAAKLTDPIRNAVEHVERQVAALAMLCGRHENDNPYLSQSSMNLHSSSTWENTWCFPAIDAMRLRQRVQAHVRCAQRSDKVAMIVDALREERHQAVQRWPAERIDGLAL